MALRRGALARSMSSRSTGRRVVVVEQGELCGGLACTEVAARKRERKTEWRRWSGVEARVAGLGRSSVIKGGERGSTSH
jgi:hypothetical protein